VEARRDDRRDRRDVLVHGRRARWRRDDLGDPLGRAVDLRQPVVPRRDRLGAPQLEELAEVLLGLRRHAAERVRDEVDTLLERGERLAVLEQTVGDEVGHGPYLPCNWVAFARNHRRVTHRPDYSSWRLATCRFAVM